MPGEDAFELSHPFVNGQPRPVRPGDGGGCVMMGNWWARNEAKVLGAMIGTAIGMLIMLGTW